MEIKIACVIVLYNDVVDTQKVIPLSKNTLVIIIDNTPQRDLKISSRNIIYIPLRMNMGVATAQNKGINVARKEHCTHILFFDQDTEMDEHYAPRMVKEYVTICQTYPNLFILGPMVINGRTNDIYKSSIHKDIELESGFHPRQNVISSGSCVELSKIEHVGPLEDDLFIDYVDHEWCWRSKAKGYVNGVTHKISLVHYIGQKEKKYLGLLIIISSPFRYYYQWRNYLWLVKREYVPLMWKINAGIKKVIYPLLYPLITSDWKEIYKHSLEGIKAGIKRHI